MSESKAKQRIVFEYRLYDKDGNPKPLWIENRLGRFFRERLGLDIQHWPFGKPGLVMRNEAKRR